MKRAAFQRSLWLLLFVSFVHLLNSGRTETLRLVTMNTPWKYNATGTNLGTDWLAASYDDAAPGWEGPAQPLFGFEATPAEYFPFPFTTLFPDPTNYPGFFVTNYYFRTHFTMPPYSREILANSLLLSTNLIDDGCVVYLNGAELFRFNMPSGPIAATDFASATLVPEGWPPTGRTVFFATNLATNVVVGDNVLAVEVHQSRFDSSDVVFGMTLNAAMASPPVITAQPLSQTNVVGANVTLAIEAAGIAPLAYQWYSNGVQIAGATGTSFTVPTPRTNSAGYFVVLNNAFGMATSEVAVVRIVVDTFPPALVSAVIRPSPGSNDVLVIYSERLNVASAVAITNYTITLLGTTNLLGATNAQHGVLVSNNASQVRLLVDSPFQFASNYVLTVNRVTDTNHNPILPNSQIGMVFSSPSLVTNLVPMNQSWRWNDSFADLGDAWKKTDYVLSASWRGPSAGFFYYDQSAADPPSFPPCATNSGTQMGGYANGTYYFRTHFDLPAGLPTAGTLVFTHVVDDGAIFYLNGTELFRFNMSSAPVSAADSSLGPITNATCITTSVSVTNLLEGTNLLAVEVHQFNWPPAGSDVVFGLQVDFNYLAGGALPPKILHSRDADNEILSWKNAGGFQWNLESTTNLSSAPWNLITSSSPFTNRVEENSFFRLRINN